MKRGAKGKAGEEERRLLSWTILVQIPAPPLPGCAIWASHLIALCLSFPICQMGMTIESSS